VHGMDMNVMIDAVDTTRKTHSKLVGRSNQKDEVDRRPKSSQSEAVRKQIRATRMVLCSCCAI